MSTLVVLKENNTLILGTDSRFMSGDFTSIVSDATQKIFEIAPETFIACSGRTMTCDFQRERAREIAVDLGGRADIQAISEALRRESAPILTELLELLRSQSDERSRQAVAGQSLLHGCVMVGRTASGQLGFVFHDYRVQAGKIECAATAYFGNERQIMFSTGVDLDQVADLSIQFTQDRTIWTDPPVRAAQRILAELKRPPSMSGGPDQIVCLDRAGAHWISRPPQAAVPLAGNLTAATISATIMMTAPTIKVTAGALVVDLAGSVPSPVGTITGTMVSHVSGGVTTDAIVTTAYAVMACGRYGSSGQNSYISQAGFLTSNGAATQAFLGPSQLQITGLPSSSPGAGSKQFWYDPSDGNRVKYTP
jgi:hypothetical protein